MALRREFLDRRLLEVRLLKVRSSALAEPASGGVR
jgi:hypothetical protein